MKVQLMICKTYEYQPCPQLKKYKLLTQKVNDNSICHNHNLGHLELHKKRVIRSKSRILGIMWQ